MNKYLKIKKKIKNNENNLKTKFDNENELGLKSPPSIGSGNELGSNTSMNMSK